MGIMDIFGGRKGALDENEYYSPENIEARNQASGLTNTAPFIPTNAVEDRLARRTMNVSSPAVPASMMPPEMGIGPPTMTEAQPAQYISPRQAYRNQMQQKYAERSRYAQEELDKKLSNPFFKVTDLIADVARETIGLPFNILNEGKAFTYDPSNDARTTTRQRLKSLEDLQDENNRLYMNGLEGRAVAMEGATNERMAAETNARQASIAGDIFNSVDTGKFTPESLSRFQDDFMQTGQRNFSLLQANPKTTVKVDPVSGRMAVYRENADGADTFVQFADSGLEQGLSNRGQIADFESFDTAKNSWYDQYDKNIVASRSRGRKLQTVTKAITEARELIENSSAAGWGGLWKDLPDSDSNALRGYLNTIRGNIGFQELRALKESGATLGQVAVMELEALQAIMGDLSQNLPADVLLQTLSDVEFNYKAADESHAEQVTKMLDMFGSRSAPAQNPYSTNSQGRGQQDTPATPKGIPAAAGGTYTPSS